MLLLAANLRPPLTEIGPILPQIRADLGLSGADASLLTALPVLCFGLFAPVVPPMLRRLGVERTVFVSLVVLMVGAVLRLVPSWSMLLAGTAVLGAAIAVGNVVLPVLVKTRFPERVGSVTGLYMMALNIAAAAAASSVVPLTAAIGRGWRGALAGWLAPIAIALLCWAPMALFGRGHTPTQSSATVPARAVLRSSRGRALIIFTASQSVIYYGMIAWLPSIFQDQGVSAAGSGFLLSVATVIGAPVALVLPTLAARATEQRAHVVALVLFAGVGLLGLLLAPTAAPYCWVVLLGIGQGGVFPLALTLFVLRTDTPAQTARVSVVAQSVAYVCAAAGPLAMGLMRDHTGSWQWPIVLLLACLGVEFVSGLRAGRAGHLRLGTQARVIH